MMSKYMVSVIIPVYNRAQLVVRTLQSVLAQSLSPIEVILVDNNSSDGTIDVLQAFKRQHCSSTFNVTVAQEKRQGAARARNLGATMASGEWLLFFDSDDTMEPYMLEKYLDVAQRENTDMVLGRADCQNLDGSKHEKPYYKTDLIVNNIFHAAACPLQCCLMSRKLFEQAGRWNEDLPTWDDWDLSMRMLLCNPRVAFYDETIAVHIFLQQQSITGTDFSSKAGTWERAIDAVECALLNTKPLPDRERLLKYIDFRRVVLSGLYIGERRRDLAKPLFDQAYSRVRHDRVARWLYPLLRSYIAAGGRGASHIVKWLVK